MAYKTDDPDSFQCLLRGKAMRIIFLDDYLGNP